MCVERRNICDNQVFFLSTAHVANMFDDFGQAAEVMKSSSFLFAQELVIHKCP